jgi:hypothetical protein
MNINTLRKGIDRNIDFTVEKQFLSRRQIVGLKYAFIVLHPEDPYRFYRYTIDAKEPAQPMSKRGGYFRDL